MTRIVENAPAARKYDQGRELLKWVAIVTMTVDHVGLLFFPEYPFFRIVGRIAFPIFAYLLVLGMESTHDTRGYFNRLLFFALISQVPYSLMNGTEPWVKLNIFFTLCLGLGTVYYVDKNSLAFILPLVASIIIPVDYGVYGTATVLFFYLLRRNWKMGAAIFVLINVVILLSDSWYQPFSVFALPLILLHDLGKPPFNWVVEQARPSTFRKYFFYAYYPLHLLLLWALKTFIIKS
jgi:hypothetical protein